MDIAKRWAKKNFRGDGLKKGHTATSRRCKRSNKRRGKRYETKLDAFEDKEEI